jgi:hypothetical protein
MSAKVFAEWLRRRGYRVIRTPSSYWHETSPHVYQAFPYHWVIEPEEKELSQLLRANQAIALRYSTPATAPKGKLSYHVVCEDPAYDLGSLRRQARQNVRRGLRYASVEPILFSRLATEGWNLRRDSLERQGRADAETEEWWRRLCTSAQDLPGFEAWGAIHEGELVASFLAFTCDDCFTLPHEQSASAHLRHRVNNAIFYGVTHQAIQRENINSVFFCLHSLDAPPSVDEFKFRMGYTARPVRQRVVFHPFLAPLLNRASHTMIKQILNRYPNHAKLSKTEGMLRFYLDGKLPANDQNMPVCLTQSSGKPDKALVSPEGLYGVKTR